MNTNKLMKWLGGGWMSELGQNPEIALKNEEIAHKEEVESKLEANWHKDD